MSIWSSRRGLASWQWLLIFVICGAATALVHRYVRIGVNSTNSIQAKVLVVIRGSIPDERGEYIVFRWQGQGGFHRPGVLFTKIVRGLPGDAVEVAANGFVTVSGGHRLREATRIQRHAAGADLPGGHTTGVLLRRGAI
jgi:type IV secretory pathway protease TraF